MAMATGFQTGINMLQVGALRMPFLFAQMNTALLVGEAAFRGLKAGLEFFGFNGESRFAQSVSALAPQGTIEILRPYRDLTGQKLFVSALACGVIGNLGATVVSKLFGPPPAIYNRVLSVLGNIRITNDLHPLVNLVSSKFGY